jgi:hypothetical protein
MEATRISTPMALVLKSGAKPNVCYSVLCEEIPRQQFLTEYTQPIGEQNVG